MPHLNSCQFEDYLSGALFLRMRYYCGLCRSYQKSLDSESDGDNLMPQEGMQYREFCECAVLEGQLSVLEASVEYHFCHFLPPLLYVSRRIPFVFIYQTIFLVYPAIRLGGRFKNKLRTFRECTLIMRLCIVMARKLCFSFLPNGKLFSCYNCKLLMKGETVSQSRLF